MTPLAVLERLLCALPLLAGLALLLQPPRSGARALAGASAGLALALALAVCALHGRAADSGGALRVDALSAPLLPLLAAAACALVLGLPGRELSARQCASLLLAEGLGLLSALASAPPLLALAAGGAAVPLLAALLRDAGPGAAQRRSAACVLGLGALALAIGAYGLSADALGPAAAPFFAGLLALGALLQLAALPLHGLQPFLFEHDLGAAALFWATQPGPYLVARLGLEPLGHGPLAQVVLALALASAAAGALLGLLETQLRRSLGCAALTAGGLLLAALLDADAETVAGALGAWCSSALALCGGAVAVWAVEARTGRSDARGLGGIAAGAPGLATAAVLFALAAAGLPGSLGFAADELLLHGWLRSRPAAALTLVAAGALTAINLLRVQLRTHLGPSQIPVSADLLPRERAALILVGLPILALGLWPAPLLDGSAASAAAVIAARRALHSGTATPALRGPQPFASRDARPEVPPRAATQTAASAERPSE